MRLAGSPRCPPQAAARSGSGWLLSKRGKRLEHRPPHMPLLLLILVLPTAEQCPFAWKGAPCGTRSRWAICGSNFPPPPPRAGWWANGSNLTHSWLVGSVVCCFLLKLLPLWMMLTEGFEEEAGRGRCASFNLCCCIGGSVDRSTNSRRSPQDRHRRTSQSRQF